MRKRDDISDSERLKQIEEKIDMLMDLFGIGKNPLTPLTRKQIEEKVERAVLEFNEKQKNKLKKLQLKATEPPRTTETGGDS